MSMILWDLPVASTALLDAGPVLEVRPRRLIALRMAFEVIDGEREATLLFEGVEAYRVTHYRARSDAMLAAYDRLIDLGASEWLADVREALITHGGDATGLAHLQINFDDGPCFEFICRTHRVEERRR